MKINIERIKYDIEYISSITSKEGEGFTRFSYSKEDLEARKYLIDELGEIGLKVNIDGVGNIRGRLEGNNPSRKPILIGSHIDTVKNGGKFDGILGVVCGIEVMRVIKENKYHLNHDIELIIFAEEEGSNFGSTMMGSKSITGKYNVENLKLLKDEMGNSAYSVIKQNNYNPDNMENEIIKSDDALAMFELHIEQGIVLDQEGISVGIVKGIFGMTNQKVTVYGTGNHAGATPMKYRNDPMVFAAKIIGKIEEIALKNESETVVATVGKINAYPNASNVIADRVTFNIDIRDIKKEGIESVVLEIKETIAIEAKESKIKIDIEEIAYSKPVLLSSSISNLLEGISIKNKTKYKTMYSGAVHDCAMFVDITEVGLIFVPSIKGRSHVPDENTNYCDIEIGCNLLLEAVADLTRGE